MSNTRINWNLFTALLLLSAQLIQAVPQGTVHVMDNRLNREVGIAGVEVALYSNGKRHVTYTDSTGTFRFSESTPNGKLELNWRHENNHFFIAANGKSVATIKGPKSHRPWNVKIKSKGEQHYYATIYRAAEAYLSSDFIKGSKLFKDLQINGHYRKKVGRGKARFNALTGEVSTWAINKNTNKPFDDIRLFGFITHEMAHVHHHAFYQGRSQHLDVKSRLRESWADAVKYFLVLDEYSGDKKFTEFKTYSKQLSFYGGWHNKDWGRSKYYELYTPLMIDLVDTLNQEAIDDRVSGYTMKQILSVMKEKNCTDFESFERFLKQRYNNPTEKYLSILFDEMEEH